VLSDGNLAYIAAAYGLVWGTLGLYVVRLWRRVGALARELPGGADAR
jgi:CcmD family protein